MGILPKNFLIGAVTAAHQVEGNNIYSDAWAQEQMEHSSNLERVWMQWIITTVIRKIFVCWRMLV